MTSSIRTLASGAAASKSPLDGKLSAARVVRTALGEMLSSPEAAGLSALAAGALVVLVRHASTREGLELNGSTTPAKEAQAVLAMKGLSASDADLVLSVLQMTGFMRAAGDVVAIPLLDEAIRAEAMALRNRIAGWVKRGASTGVANTTPRMAPAPTPMAASAAPAPAPAVPAEPQEAAPVDAAETPVESPANRKSQRRIEAGVEYCRFTSSDKKFTSLADDPVVVRIRCKGDSVAEITDDYIADLRAAFRSVDIEDELRKCRLWCESNSKLRKTFSGFRRFLNSWLTNAMRDSQVRNAVARNAQARNGFGQGGTYAAPAATEASATPSEPNLADPRPAQGGLMDDFADLLGAPSSPAARDEPETPEVAAPAAPARPVVDECIAPVSQEPLPREVPKTVSKAVLAARARLQHGAAATAGR